MNNPFLYLKSHIKDLDIDEKLIPAFENILVKLNDYFKKTGLYKTKDYYKIINIYLLSKKIKFRVSDEPSKIGANGYYDMQKNEIVIDEKTVANSQAFLETTLCHEFIHFLAMNGKNMFPIDRPINEAYTESLTRKVLQSKKTWSYESFVRMINFMNQLYDIQTNYYDFMSNLSFFYPNLVQYEFKKKLYQYYKNYEEKGFNIRIAITDEDYIESQRELLKSKIKHIKTIEDLEKFLTLLDNRPVKDDKYMKTYYKDLAKSLAKNLTGIDSSYNQIIEKLIIKLINDKIEEKEKVFVFESFNRDLTYDRKTNTISGNTTGLDIKIDEDSIYIRNGNMTEIVNRNRDQGLDLIIAEDKRLIRQYTKRSNKEILLRILSNSRDVKEIQQVHLDKSDIEKIDKSISMPNGGLDLFIVSTNKQILVLDHSISTGIITKKDLEGYLMPIYDKKNIPNKVLISVGAKIYKKSLSDEERENRSSYDDEKYEDEFINKYEALSEEEKSVYLDKIIDRLPKFTIIREHGVNRIYLVTEDEKLIVCKSTNIYNSDLIPDRELYSEICKIEKKDIEKLSGRRIKLDEDDNLEIWHENKIPSQTYTNLYESTFNEKVEKILNSPTEIANFHILFSKANRLYQELSHQLGYVPQKEGNPALTVIGSLNTEAIIDTIKNNPEAIQILIKIKELDESEGKDVSYLNDIIKVYSLYESTYKNEQTSNIQVIVKDDIDMFNLYDTFFYEEEKEIFKNKEKSEFERMFSIANELFIICSLYDKTIAEDRDELSKKVFDILEKEPYAFEVLRNAEGIEKDEKKKDRLNKSIEIVATHKEILDSKKHY